ncbi:hypothetical protein MMC07_002398 [Pseudocyphellaria aurata]|nr:hypothetical protein [Pseudocyphellaria aurata]
MSSMRNAVQRRNHRERAQPIERQKWGVLEKHKDYRLRAKDYNEKKKRLQILRQKAADRNPDEFHFEMISSKTHDKGQKVADRGNAALSQDAVKLLKTQDAGYLKTMVQKTRKARERLEQDPTIRGSHNAGVPGRESKPVQDRHMYFVDTVEDQKQFNVKGFPGLNRTGHNSADELSRVDQDDSLENENETDKEASKLLNGGNRSRSLRDLEEDALTLRNDRALRKLRKRTEEARVSRLNLLKLRERELLAAEQELGLQRAKMSNSVGGISKAGFKWKPRERKR